MKSGESDGLPFLSPVVRGNTPVKPRMVFWEGRYITVQELYAVRRITVVLNEVQAGPTPPSFNV